jgi:hypothetical protein
VTCRHQTADDAVILATHEGPAIASVKVQDNIKVINDWVKKCRIKINESKFTHISFALRNQTCPTVQMGGVALPQQRGETPGYGF